MKITRLYTGDDGQSHFGEVEVPMQPRGGAEISEMQSATGISFRWAPADLLIDFHNAPRRQYVITLTGEVEIETGDGMVRRFGPGSIFLAEDTTGKGHISRGVGDVPRLSAYVPLAD